MRKLPEIKVCADCPCSIIAIEEEGDSCALTAALSAASRPPEVIPAGILAPPPDWCPLRAGPVTLSLRAGV